MEGDAHREREHFFGAAKLVAAVTMLSRVLGMVRDIAIVALGATRATDSFWAAFSIPNLFRRLFGEGALSAAFVPVFTETAEAEGWDRARLVLANVAGLLALVLAAVVVLAELAVAAWLLTAPGEWDRRLLLQLTMIVLPFLFTVCLLALGSAALNCKGHFAYPAFAPILLNIGMIVAAAVAHRLYVGDDWRALFLLAGAVVAAGVGQLLGVVWLLSRAGLAVVPKLRPLLPEARRTARLLLPTVAPLGILQFSAFFDRIYAWVMTATAEAPRLELLGLSIDKPLGPGVVTCLYAANRLYQFPLGILAISLATAVFPLFSRYAARKDRFGLRDAVNRALRLSLFLGIPAGVGLALLAGPATRLIYRHGNFTDAEASLAARILAMYCLGMPAYFCNHILLRAFFAQKDTRTPMRVTVLAAGLNIVLVAVGIFTPLAGGAIGLATAVTATLSAGALAVALAHRLGGVGLRKLAVSSVRTAAASAVLAGAVWAIPALLAGAGVSAEAGLTERLIAVAAAVTGGAAAYAGAAALLRCPELQELWGALRRGKQPDRPLQ